LFCREKLLICFTGVDGSGKTKHAKHLLHFLRKRKYSSLYVRAASRPIFVYPFLIITRILGYWKTIKKDSWTNPLENAPPIIRKKFGMLYRFLLFIDFEIISLLKVWLPLLFVRVVICDRYVYDLIVELALSSLHSKNFAKLILYATPKPKRTFLTHAPPQLVVQRRPSLTIRSLHAKMVAYLKLARILDFEVVDTATKFEVNQDNIRRQVLSFLEGTS